MKAMSEQYVPDLPTNDALNAAADRRVWAYDAPGATDEQLAAADSAFVNEVHIAILQSDCLAAHDREVKAEAWDEGFRAGRSADHNSMWWPPNPYRIESQGTP